MTTRYNENKKIVMVVNFGCNVIHISTAKYSPGNTPYIISSDYIDYPGYTPNGKFVSTGAASSPNANPVASEADLKDLYDYLAESYPADTPEEMENRKQIDVFVGLPGVFFKLNPGTFHNSFPARHSITEADIRVFYDTQKFTPDPGYKTVLISPVSFCTDSVSSVCNPVGITASYCEAQLCAYDMAEDVLNAICSVFRRAGFTKLVCFPTALASALTYIPYTERNSSAVLIECDQRGSYIYGIRGNALRQQFYAPYGLDQLLEDTLQCMQQSSPGNYQDARLRNSLQENLYSCMLKRKPLLPSEEASRYVPDNDGNESIAVIENGIKKVLQGDYFTQYFGLPNRRQARSIFNFFSGWIGENYPHVHTVYVTDTVGIFSIHGASDIFAENNPFSVHINRFTVPFCYSVTVEQGQRQIPAISVSCNQEEFVCLMACISFALDYINGNRFFLNL